MVAYALEAQVIAVGGAVADEVPTPDLPRARDADPRTKVGAPTMASRLRKRRLLYWRKVMAPAYRAEPSVEDESEDLGVGSTRLVRMVFAGTVELRAGGFGMHHVGAPPAPAGGPAPPSLLD